MITPIRNYEVVCSWIASATSEDHIKCIYKYVQNVFMVMYPIKKSFVDSVNHMHKELTEQLLEKITLKLNEINNISLTTDEPNID